jgi:hypothetical protein
MRYFAGLLLMSSAIGDFWIGLVLGFALGWRLKPKATARSSPFIECTHCHEAVRTGSSICTHCHSKIEAA